MATWGSYFSFAKKNVGAPADGENLQDEKAKITPQPKPTNPQSTSSATKKLYDLSTMPPADQVPRSSSNAARRAKLFGYTNPALEVGGIDEKPVQADPKPREEVQSIQSVRISTNRALSQLESLLDLEQPALSMSVDHGNSDIFSVSQIMVN